MTPLQRAIFAGLIAAGLAGAFHVLSVGSAYLLITVAGALLLIYGAPHLTAWVADKVREQTRAAMWRGQEGRHHSVGGVALDIDDDGRHVWIGAAGLRKALSSSDTDDVLAARHTGRWRRGDKGVLWLRADAVVAHLETAPGRMDPHTIRVRRYLQEQVLFPASERRRRAQQPGQGPV
jgi:hypothetical protein